jgi:hypothetical protein
MAEKRRVQVFFGSLRCAAGWAWVRFFQSSLCFQHVIGFVRKICSFLGLAFPRDLVWLRFVIGIVFFVAPFPHNEASPGSLRGKRPGEYTPGFMNIRHEMWTHRVSQAEVLQGCLQVFA